MSAGFPPGDTAPGAAPAPRVVLGAEPAAPIDFPIAGIAGIGASARGLGAFEACFSGMPASADLNLAVVLAQQLAQDQHERAIVVRTAGAASP